jgi:hypothetical protein
MGSVTKTNTCVTKYIENVTMIIRKMLSAFLTGQILQSFTLLKQGD